MRRLVWTIAVLAVLWGIWWLLATTALETGLNKWLEQRRSAGWQADVSAVQLGGFPGRFDLGMDKLALKSPRTGHGFSADALRITALSYWPGNLAVHFPQTAVDISTPDVAFALTAPDARAALRLHPSPALQLDHLNAVSGPWQLDLQQGNLLNAQGFAGELRQGGTAEVYRITLDIAQLVPGGMVRRALSLPLDWPLAFDTAVADATVTFDAPLDRHTLNQPAPSPREIEIQQIALSWGPVKINLAGQIQLDASGTPEGQLDLLIENWRAALELAENAGLLGADMRPQAEVMLNALANLGGDPARLDLKLRFAEGRAFLGPIPIGPAPRLFQR